MRLVASILVLAMLSQGCSVIGLGMGLQTPETETIESRDIAIVEPGTEMEIVVETDLNKTATLRGRFASVLDSGVLLVGFLLAGGRGNRVFC